MGKTPLSEQIRIMATTTSSAVGYFAKTAKHQASWAARNRDGKPLGKSVEVEYDMVDLPAWNFDQPVGGPVLRLVLGILKKMIEGHGEEFSEALLPLLEISDEEQK